MHTWKWVFLRKNRDVMVCPFCKKKIWTEKRKGTFDFSDIQIPVWSKKDVVIAHVEVKAGTTAYSFDDFDIDKRNWAAEHQDDLLLIWLELGYKIYHKKYPKQAWLFPLSLFYELEQTLERKSIPYGCAKLDAYKLDWAQYGVWGLRDNHPVRKSIGDC